MTPGPCAKCGGTADARYCQTCADALLEAATHLAAYATDLREQLESTTRERDDYQAALRDCARALAAKSAGTP